MRSCTIKLLNYINKTPLRAFLFVFFITAAIVLLITAFWESINPFFSELSLGLYSKEFLENILIEAHGMVFDILVIGVIVVWLDTRRTKHKEVMSMQNNLSDLAYLDLPEVNHRKAGMLKRLHNAGVTSLNIDSLILKSIKLKGIMLDSSNLKKSNFSKSEIHTCHFKNTHLEQANFSSSLIKNSIFSECKLKKANFIKANIQGVDFSKSDLERVKFIETNLQSCLFKDTNLREVNFEKSNLRNANLKGALYLTIDLLLKADCLDYIILDDNLADELKERNRNIKGYS